MIETRPFDPAAYRDNDVGTNPDNSPAPQCRLSELFCLPGILEAQLQEINASGDGTFSRKRW